MGSWKLWVALGLAAWGSFNAYQLRGARLALTEYKLEVSQANERAQAQKNTDLIIRMRNKERIDEEHDKREQALAAERAVTGRSLASLRSEVARLNGRRPPDDTEARKYAHEASVARGVAEQCSERYRWLDGEAKKLGSQVIGLQAYVTDVCQAGSVQKSAPLAADDL